MSRYLQAGRGKGQMNVNITVALHLKRLIISDKERPEVNWFLFRCVSFDSFSELLI